MDPEDTTTFAVTPKAEPENEFYLLQLDSQLQVGKMYEVYIKFTAPIATAKDKLSGLYRSSYYNAETLKVS